MKNPFKKHRIRGHLLDAMEKLERSLLSFTNGNQKSKEIERFSKEEESELFSFQLQVSLMVGKLKKKLTELYRGKKLTDAQFSRLPDSVREELYPTDEEKRINEESKILIKGFSDI
jgi:hypothetical protein